MAVTKVWIEDGCTVCGVCSDLCPDVFVMGDETSSVIAGANLAANTDCIKDAATNCPVEIIKFEE
jgi:ferredoxin